jgi:hypothetical protein
MPTQYAKPDSPWHNLKLYFGLNSLKATVARSATPLVTIKPLGYVARSSSGDGRCRLKLRELQVISRDSVLKIIDAAEFYSDLA